MNHSLEIYEGTFGNFGYGNMTVALNDTGAPRLQMRLGPMGLWNLHADPSGGGNAFWNLLRLNLSVKCAFYTAHAAHNQLRTIKSLLTMGVAILMGVWCHLKCFFGFTWLITSQLIALWGIANFGGTWTRSACFTQKTSSNWHPGVPWKGYPHQTGRGVVIALPPSLKP